MEAPHPLLQPAVVGVHVVDVEIWRLRLGRAGCGQDMELDSGAPSECGDRRTSIAAQFRWPGNDLPERGCIEPRQDGIDGRAGAVAGDDDWDLLRRQTPLGGLAAPLARCSRQIAAFALEGFEDEGLVRLDDPGQARRLVEIERGQEPMSPPERGGVGHLAAFRGLRDRLAGDQRLRRVRPAILVMQAGQRRPGQRVECLLAARAAVPRLAASLAPGTNVIPTAVRTAKARNPTPPDLRQQVFLRRGIVRLRDRERRRNSSLIRQHRSIDRVSRRVDRIVRFGQRQFPERLCALRRIQKPNPAKPSRKRRCVHLTQPSKHDPTLSSLNRVRNMSPVLGILYESLIHPISVLSTLFSASVGAALALWLFNTQFTVIAAIGVLLLIGIVKKNAIMMVDFALAAERQGRGTREAIEQACLLRFRPIMMTTCAAIFGALPLAFGTGEGSELRHPLGITIVGGLIVGQVLTLYTTPVVFIYLDSFAKQLRRLWNRYYVRVNPAPLARAQ